MPVFHGAGSRPESAAVVAGGLVEQKALDCTGIQAAQVARYVVRLEQAVGKVRLSLLMRRAGHASPPSLGCLPRSGGAAAVVCFGLFVLRDP